MLDLACGNGRHAIAAARGGADVVAIDHERERFKDAAAIAETEGVSVAWRVADLRTLTLPKSTFDVVMIFNYLDRARMPDFLFALRPGGHLLFETFLAAQTQFGWGPTSVDHLLQPGEIQHMTAPLETIMARDVLEVVQDRQAFRASILARRREQ